MDNATEQAEELVALNEIYRDDCHVQSDEPGQVSLALRINVETWTASGSVEVYAEMPADVDSADEASSTEPANMKLCQESLSSSSTCDAVKLAKHAIMRQAETVSAVQPAVQKSCSGKVSIMGPVAVKHLPPLSLQLSLPPAYPAEASPDYHLACAWLTAEDLALLCAEMDQRAQDTQGSPIIFIWAELLRSEVASILNLEEAITLRVSSSASDERALAECVDPRATLTELVIYDKQRDLILWRNQVQECGICFSDKAGTQFVFLGGCSHAFCCECMSQMAQIHVTEGTITELRCPVAGCRAEISPAALEQILDDEAYDRWYRLRMQQVMSTELQGLVFCPRCEDMGTETPVMPQETASEEEAPLAHCSRCFYAFCSKCLGVWHSELKDCISSTERHLQSAIRRAENKTGTKSLAEKRADEKLLKEYTITVINGYPGPKVDVTAHLIEDWYEEAHEGDKVVTVWEGSRRIWAEADGAGPALEQALALSGITVKLRPDKGKSADRIRARRVMEELLTLKAISQDSQRCPRCHVTISRSEGCNHMKCTKCATHFCYKCGKILDSDHPYSHFKAGGCPTFSQEEVQRIAVRERQVAFGQEDAELVRLQRQFGDQAALFAAFQEGRRHRGHVPTPSAKLKLGESKCPTCGHFNPRQGTLNHIRCPNCKSSYCAECRKKIVGVVPLHYKGEGACPMHKAANP